MRWQKLWARQNTYHFQRVNQGSYYVAEPATQPSLVALVWRLFVFSFMITIIHCITLENILISKTETPLLKCQLLFTWPHSKAPMSPDFIWQAKKAAEAWEPENEAIVFTRSLHKVLYQNPFVCIYHQPHTQTPHGLGMRLSLHVACMYDWMFIDWPMVGNWELMVDHRLHATVSVWLFMLQLRTGHWYSLRWSWWSHPAASHHVPTYTRRLRTSNVDCKT